MQQIVPRLTSFLKSRDIDVLSEKKRARRKDGVRPAGLSASASRIFR